jgi:hypothetical protein
MARTDPAMRDGFEISEIALKMGTWTHLNHLLYWQRRETLR